MSLVPERNVCAIFTVALRETLPFCRRSEFSRTRPLLTFVSSSMAVSTTSSPLREVVRQVADLLPEDVGERREDVERPLREAAARRLDAACRG